MTSTASQTYLIVSHGGYIQELISWLFDEYGFEQPEGYEEYFWQSPNQPNASLTRMSMTLYVCTGAAGLSNITFSSVFCNQHLKGKQGLKEGHSLSLGERINEFTGLSWDPRNLLWQKYV